MLGETTRKGSEVPMLFKELDVAQKVVHVRSRRRYGYPVRANTRDSGHRSGQAKAAKVWAMALKKR